MERFSSVQTVKRPLPNGIPKQTSKGQFATEYPPPSSTINHNFISSPQCSLLRSRAPSIHCRFACTESGSWLVVHSVVPIPSFLLEESQHARHQHAHSAHRWCHQWTLVLRIASFVAVAGAKRLHNESILIRAVARFSGVSIDTDSVQNGNIKRRQLAEIIVGRQFLQQHPTTVSI